MTTARTLRGLWRATLSLLLFALLLPQRASGASPFFDSDPGRLRILDYENGSAARLLFLDIDRAATSLLKRGPAWQSADRAEADENALATEAASGAYDIVITPDEPFMRMLESRGVLHDRSALFSSELLLVGPSASPLAGSTLPIRKLMNEIFISGSLFFSPMEQPWLEAEERRIWREAGIKDPGDNLNYVESGRDSLSLLLQAEDESGYTITAAGEYAQYLMSSRIEQPLVIIARTGFFRMHYLCLIDHKGFRPERAENADSLANMLLGDEGRRLIRSFSLAGMSPFLAQQ